MKRGTLAGVLSGVLGLTLLEAFLSGPQSNNVGGMLTGLGSLVRKWADPTVPLIPDLRAAGAPANPDPQVNPSSLTGSSSSRLPPTVPA